MKYFIILIILGVIILGCSNEALDPNNGIYSISGKVSNSYGPVSNAKVTVDNKANWETTTSSTGEFSISNVSSGDHTVYVEKKGEDEDFVEMNYPIFVNTNLTLDNLILPIPLRLFPPTNISQTEMTILWNQTDAQDFREYKLYRRNTPGLDETTGELIYVATSTIDTSFVDENLIPYETYYYRVYLMNEYGRMGGSNIESAPTLGGNLIPDGSFEDPTSFYENWFILHGAGALSYDDSIKVEGNYSLFGSLSPYVVISSIKTIHLLAGKTYELSGWGKANGFWSPTQYDWVGIDIIGNNFTQPFLRFFYSPPGLVDSVDIDWTFKSKFFTPSEDVIVTIELHGGFDRVWFDELKLEVIE